MPCLRVPRPVVLTPINIIAQPCYRARVQSATQPHKGILNLLLNCTRESRSSFVVSVEAAMHVKNFHALGDQGLGGLVPEFVDYGETLGSSEQREITRLP